MPVLDELIVVDGSETGPSTDATRAIINSFSSKYPGIIRYLSGTFVRSDGAWDCSSQWTAGIERVTGDFVMCTAADIIYGHEDTIMARKAVEAFPDRKYFYAPFVEFFGDTKHIVVQDVMTKEPALPRLVCSHAVWVSTSLDVFCVDVKNKEAFGTNEPIDWKRDIIFMPHVKRFHFGYVKPFRYQVEKVIKYVRRGEHAEISSDAGAEAIHEYAVKFVLGFAASNRIPYTGVYPEVAMSLKDRTAMDGYEDFMETYNARSAVC